MHVDDCVVENICFSSIFHPLHPKPKDATAICMTHDFVVFQQSVSRFGRQWVYGHIYLVSLRQIPTPITAVNFLPICLCSYSKDQSSSAPYSYF